METMGRAYRSVVSAYGNVSCFSPAVCAEGFDDMVFHQLQIPCFTPKECTQSVVRPERVYEQLVGYTQFCFRRMLIMNAAHHR